MKNGFMLALALILLLLPLCGTAENLSIRDFSEVKDRFATNPRHVKNIGDPFVLTRGEEYLVFATGGSIGFNVWSSRNLTTFEMQKALKKVDWAISDYWAPEVFQIGEKYVMLFTARQRKIGSLRTGIAFSDSPEGPYEDPLGHPLMDFGFATIDATLAWDDEGHPYLIFVRDCSENWVVNRRESQIYGVRLADDLLSTEGEPVLLLKPEGEWEMQSGDPLWNEGPAVVRHDGKYYLFYSTNGYFMKEYSVCAAVSDSPLGPYVKQGNNPLLYYVDGDGKTAVSGPGHNAFFKVGDELYTSYHTHTFPQAPSGDRQLCIDRAGFHADGTAYLNGPTLAPQPRPLAETGCVNQTLTAECTEDPEGLLTDGDLCMREGSRPWVWHGDSAVFRWPESVKADLLLIWPAEGQAVSGRITLNETLTADFTQPEAEQPGQAVILPFEETSVTSLRVDFSSEAAIGEIMLIGSKD